VVGQTPARPPGADKDMQGMERRHKGRMTMRRLVARVLREDRGQDLIEYALLAGFISLVAITAITDIGSVVNSWYQGYGTTIKTIPSGS
jgi:Flp pilus assembly pilin Flp